MHGKLSIFSAPVTTTLPSKLLTLAMSHQPQAGALPCDRLTVVVMGRNGMRRIVIARL